MRRIYNSKKVYMFTKIVARISESGQVQIYMCTHTLHLGSIENMRGGILHVAM